MADQQTRAERAAEHERRKKSTVRRRMRIMRRSIGLSIISRLGPFALRRLHASWKAERLEPQHWEAVGGGRQGLLIALWHGRMVCGMADAEIDLQGGRGALWDVPAGRMKMGKAFACPLNDLAVSLIRSGERVALNPRGLANAVASLCETLAMVPWTPHDLRRTASKRLRQAGYTRNQVGAFLAHEAEGDATMRHYDPEDRWDDFAIKREMSDRLAVIIREIVGGVVELRSVA